MREGLWLGKENHSEVREVASGKEFIYKGKKVGFSLPGWDLCTIEHGKSQSHFPSFLNTT